LCVCIRVYTDNCRYIHIIVCIYVYKYTYTHIPSYDHTYIYVYISLNKLTYTCIGDKLRIANAMVLRRAPEILVISIESSHLSSQFLAQTTKPTIKGPLAIRYPETFDLALFSPNNNNSNTSHSHPQETSKIYDLSTVVALEGSNLDSLQTYFRIAGEEQEESWYRGAGFVCEEVSKGRVVEGNFYGGNAEKRVHPRLLVYTRRDLPQVLDRTLHLVSKAGQMRALGDVAFAVAMTTENYGEARRCYEEAIALDEGLRVALQENLSSLEKIERTQRARVLEEQADLALANKRYREASELYSKGMMNAVVSSGVYLRVRDKLESVTHIIALDSACQFAEKGEEALRLGLLPNAKDLYSQAFKLNPEFLHLHTILVGIDKTVQMQTAGQKIGDAQTAAKAYHYKLANHFYR
jgi:tetratricopeptide (TPR) repeat protein